MYEYYLSGVTMVSAEVQGGVAAVGYERGVEDAEWQYLLQRMAINLSHLMTAKSRRQIRRLLNECFVEYSAIRIQVLGMLGRIAETQGMSSEELAKELNSAALDALQLGPVNYLSRKDKEFLLEVLREQIASSSLDTNIPKENRILIRRALINGYVARTKLDMAITAAMFANSGNLKPEREEIPHWLCLEAKQQLGDWQSALFSSDPVLIERLRRPLDSIETISMEEMERRHGL